MRYNRIVGQKMGDVPEQFPVRETGQILNKFEAICCVYDTENKNWTCLSAADVSHPQYAPNKHEILEVKGKKFAQLNKLLKDHFLYELVGFKPEEGKVTWISFNRDSILHSLCEDIKSLAKTGKTRWANI